MLRIGLTGGIGAGKSTVATRLRELGATIIDADQLAREVVEPGTPGLAAVIEAFGPSVLLADGRLDRPALGRIIFSDDEQRARLNGILHPLIGRLSQEQAEAGGSVVVHDIPLLVESRGTAGFDLVIVVHAPEEERLRRLLEDRGMNRDDALARIRAQASDEERRAAADVWIDNSGSREATIAQVDAAWAERIAPLVEIGDADRAGEQPARE
jgi:dephospho-CoA kinase